MDDATNRATWRGLGWIFAGAVAIWLVGSAVGCSTSSTVDELLERIPVNYNPSARRNEDDELEAYVRARSKLVQFCVEQRAKGAECDPDS